MVVGAALALAVVAGTAGCRSAEDKAAERAQDACIGALEPVADGKTVSAATLRDAVDDAEAAARVDRRWHPLRAILREATANQAKPAAFARSVDALAAECGRVNDIVRSGGREPKGA